MTRPIIAALGIGIAVILTGCSISTAPNPDPGLGALQGDVTAVRSTATPDPAGTTRALTQLRTDVARLQKDNQLSTARTTSILTPPHVKGTYGFAILLPSDVPGRRHFDTSRAAVDPDQATSSRRRCTSALIRSSAVRTGSSRCVGEPRIQPATTRHENVQLLGQGLDRRCKPDRDGHLFGRVVTTHAGIGSQTVPPPRGNLLNELLHISNSWLRSFSIRPPVRAVRPPPGLTPPRARLVLSVLIAVPSAEPVLATPDRPPRPRTLSRQS